jgi:hypothetical protein
MFIKLILTFCIFLLLLSCSKAEDHSLALTVLADRTETDAITPPDIFTIRSVCNISKYPERSIDFRFLNIGNTDFNPVYHAELATADILGNKLERKSAVTTFFNVIDTLLVKENEYKYEYQTSSILTPLTEQLIRLQQTDASEKVVLLYSDVFEHSSLISAYSKYDTKRIRKSPTLVANELRDKLQLTDFSGITLVIVHHPKTVADNYRFKLFVQLYRELFSNTNLNIRIGLENQLN